MPAPIVRLISWLRRSGTTKPRTSGSWLGGNQYRLLCESLEDRITPDAGPRVIGVTPLEVRNAVFDHVDVQFSRVLDATSFTTSDVTLQGLGGSVTVTGVSMTVADTARVAFTPIIVRGAYTLTIGPDVRDTLGNLMDQNGNNVAGEAADKSVTGLVYVSANAIFSTAATISESNLSYEGKDLLIDGKTVAIDGPHAFNSIHIVNGGVLTHSANTTTATHKLDVTVTEQVIVSASSLIDVRGRGYVAGRTSGNSTVGGAQGGAGGSYGGRGGASDASNLAYGDYADPGEPGAGSGPLTGGTGGGLVRVTAGTLALDGQILAGATVNGAGGGVFVSAGTLAGAGSIRAEGGSFSHPSGGYAGGGGRIAVYYRANAGFNLNNLFAPGGGGSHISGGAGTVYLRDTDDPRGTLIVDGSSGGGGFTPLGLPGRSAVTFTDDVVVRGSQANAGPDHAGMSLNFAAGLTIQSSAKFASAEPIHVAATGSLLVSSGGRLTVPGGLNADSPVTVSGGTIEGGKLIAPALSVINGGSLTHTADTATQAFSLELQVAGALTIDASSLIDVRGRGYVAGRTSGNSTVGGAQGGAGGSYGGRGGASDSSNLAYVSPAKLWSQLLPN